METTKTTAAASVTPSPRTAVIWAALRAELARHGDASLRVVDVGGGTGGFAVPLAQAGHHVTVVDASPDALASLTRRAADADVADRVRGVQGDGDQLAILVPPASVDIVLCHSVLEQVDDPAAVLAAVAAALRLGGVASIVVANRRGAAVARALAGHFQAATALLRDTAAPASPRGPARRFDAESAAAMVAGAGLTVETISGVRVIADLLPGALADADAAGLLEFELAAAHEPAFRDIATQLHVLARRG